MKALQDNARVLIDSECRVTDRLPHLGAVPELLMSGPPFRDRTETLTLIGGVPGTDVTEPDYRDTCGLDHGHRLFGAVGAHGRLGGVAADAERCGDAESV